MISNIEKAIPKRRLKHDHDGARADKNRRQEEYKARPIANDGEEADDLFKSIIPHFVRLLRSGGCCCCCCCGGGGPGPQFARWSLWLDKEMDFKQMVVWDKGPMGMGWHYRRSYETVLVTTKKGGKCKWYDKTMKIENIVRPGDYGIRKIIPSADQHPTEKPIELAAHFISLHTQEGDTVLDPFMGSGTTGMACKKLGRKFIGIEFDRHWYNEARKRLRENTVVKDKDDVQIIYPKPKLF